MESPEDIQFTLLEILIGEDANQKAKESLDWLTYETPIEGQEYLAIRGTIKVIKSGDNNEVIPIYPYWSLTLRYSEDGQDTYSIDAFEIFNEGYPPVEGSGWVFFLIREGSTPYLYFQPDLVIVEQAGIRSHGAYFTLLE